MSRKSNTFNEFILSYEISLYLSNFFVGIENNDLNFDKFIKNCKTNSYKFNENVYKKFSNIRNFQYFYDADEYIIK